jgi:hypothetical protein
MSYALFQANFTKVIVQCIENLSLVFHTTNMINNISKHFVISSIIVNRVRHVVSSWSHDARTCTLYYIVYGYFFVNVMLHGSCVSRSCIAFMYTLTICSNGIDQPYVYYRISNDKEALPLISK